MLCCLIGCGEKLGDRLEICVYGDEMITVDTQWGESVDGVEEGIFVDRLLVYRRKCKKRSSTYDDRLSLGSLNNVNT